MNSSSGLRWSDAWFLVALARCRDKEACRVRDVVQAADEIDHAIMSFEEMSSALVRLEGAGLVEASAPPAVFRCTDRGRAMVDEAIRGARGLLEACRALEARLGAESWIPGEPLPHPANSLRHPGLPEEDYRREVQAYLDGRRRLTPSTPPGS